MAARSPAFAVIILFTKHVRMLFELPYSKIERDDLSFSGLKSYPSYGARGRHNV